MKKIWGIILSAVMTAALVFPVYSSESAYIPGLTSIEEEPDGSGIPKDDPVSTTGSAYGYNGTFSIEAASFQPARVSEGAWELNDTQILYWGGGVVQAEGEASLILRDSYLRGETAVPARPLQGESGHLLVSGNIRTALGLGSSQTYFINSTIASRNLGALSLMQADQPMTEGGNELSTYLYGSEAITMDAGYGAYVGRLSNLFSYGSHIQAAEAGIISDTFGRVVLGSYEKGEANYGLAAYLSQEDKDKHSDKKAGNIVEGGRNALVITSQNKSEYWTYEGYSQDMIPWRYADISADTTAFRTDAGLNKGIQYEPAQQGYIDHTSGSVILVKSTNAQMILDNCEIIPDSSGTGYLIQSVLSNDPEYINTAPDAQDNPGILVDMRNMKVTGDIAHEDYQRKFMLLMDNTVLTGAVNEYDCGHWNAAAAGEGFTDYAPDADYSSHYGISVSLTKGSVWNVTKESHLSRLYTEADCQVNGVILVNGVQQAYTPGSIYEGDVVVMPAGAGQSTQAPTQPATQAPTQPPTQPPTSPKPTEPATKPTEPVPKPTEPAAKPTEPATKPTEPATKATGHVHNWVLEADVPATCTMDGYKQYYCTGCTETYSEPNGQKAHGHKMSSAPIGVMPADCINSGQEIYQCEYCGITQIKDIPALGHNWVLTTNVEAYCETPGQTVYTCSNCGETYKEEFAALGHDWKFSYSVPAACETEGFDVYQCSRCGASEQFNNVPALGHDYKETNHTPADCISDEVYEYTCSGCGHVYYETIFGTALGHNYQVTAHVDPTCSSDGYDQYTCSNCGDTYYHNLPASSHNWVYQYSVPVTCLTSGYDVYQCSNCGTEDWFNFAEAQGHSYIVYPTPGAESMTHTYECTNCGDTYTEIHSSGEGGCPVCGYSGAFG